ncbi:uncharacterized protein PGTG_15809 [Puccinia graminis f. sp. tritici CRL 75-36-700-3]|uniref:Uncharacterized protein n=1 Tax=Puccinia graminis f. sp. tritici (strain CRL 75-36-700-3 / race SCCL) TaxID=418459 RepID=E3KZX2_PUCGT|nr:uncharacterized protein PGTG_15809 [Puccinia graminis f. sp. tritici CRL 75-36-700-3]EFP89853.1 hypothetical protein PGTG_15809 [Puccinia graminis f. sp. tritici CRL 75-36-700-3]
MACRQASHLPAGGIPCSLLGGVPPGKLVYVPACREGFLPGKQVYVPACREDSPSDELVHNPARRKGILPEGFLRAHVQEYKARTEGFPIEPRRGSLEGANEVGRRTKLSRATELIARLKSRGKLNQVIYNALLNALFSTREFESGLEVFKLMKLELDSSQNAHPGIELLTSE